MTSFVVIFVSHRILIFVLYTSIVFYSLFLSLSFSFSFSFVKQLMVSSFYCMPLGFPSGVEEFYVFNRRSVPRPILAHAIRLQLSERIDVVVEHVDTSI